MKVSFCSNSVHSMIYCWARWLSMSWRNRPEKKDNKRNKHSIFCWISIGIYLFTDLRMWSECCRVCSSPLGTCSSGGPAGSRWIVKLITNSWKEKVNNRKFYDFIMCKIVEYKVKYCIILRKLQIRWFLWIHIYWNSFT